MVVFFICIYVVALNNRIYVSVTYVLCLYGCSWVILLTTCGCKTIVSTIEHTFVFDMKTTISFYLRHSTTRYNHRIIPLKFIYLRYTVVLICVVYKYTAVDINTPYRRFKPILWCFLLSYMWYTPRIFSFVYIYMYMSTVFYIYIYIYLTPIFICICVHILIHIFVFSRHYILTARVFATTCETAIHSKHLFDLIHSKFSIRLKTLDE